MSRATASGVPPSLAIRSTVACSSGGAWPPSAATKLTIASPGALAQPRAVEVDAAHPRLGAEGHEVRRGVEVVLADAVLLGEHDDRAALGRLVGERGDLRDLGQLGLLDAGHRQELRRLAVAERDRAGLVEQQHVDVAGGLDRRGPTARARCGARAGPCRRSRSPTAARRSWSGSATPAARSAWRSRRRCPRTRRTGAASRRRRGRSASGRRAGSRARSRSASCAARRPRRARSSGRGSSCRAPG